MRLRLRRLRRVRRRIWIRMGWERLRLRVRMRIRRGGRGSRVGRILLQEARMQMQDPLEGRVRGRSPSTVPSVCRPLWIPHRPGLRGTVPL